MGQSEIVDPAASGKLIFSIQPYDRPGTTLNSFGRCLKIIDTFRAVNGEPVRWPGSNGPGLAGPAGPSSAQSRWPASIAALSRTRCGKLWKIAASSNASRRTATGAGPSLRKRSRHICICERRYQEIYSFYSFYYALTLLRKVIAYAPHGSAWGGRA